MREIKFRAWDKEQEVAFSWIELTDNHRDRHISALSLPDFDEMAKDDSFSIMQFTGLKDKDGVEIYESDIVRCNDGHVGIIEWEDHDCCFNVRGYYNALNDYPSMAFMEGQPFEVIGNVYEQPELLTN